MGWQMYGHCTCEDTAPNGFTLQVPVDSKAGAFGICGESLRVTHELGESVCTLSGVSSLKPNLSNLKVAVALVAAGNSHGIFVLNSRRTLVWGYNQYHQLAHPDINLYAQTPIEIAPLEGFHVCKLAVGEAHTLAVTSENAIYSWGRNDKGQLGRTDSALVGEISFDLPQKDLTKDVSEVCAGRLHSAAIVRNSLYTWGWGLYGQLGHGDTSDQALPKLVSALNGVGRIIDGGARYEDVSGVDCGAWHTVVLSVTGDVYAFGWNNYGQVKPKPDSAPGAVYSPVLVFEEARLSDAYAIQVAAGYRHSAVRFKGFSNRVCLYGMVYKAEKGFEVTRPRFIGDAADNGETARNALHCGRWCTHYHLSAA